MVDDQNQVIDIVMGVLLAFSDFPIGVRALANVILMFFTAPVAGYMLARATYLPGGPLWK